MPGLGACGESLSLPGTLVLSDLIGDTHIDRIDYAAV